MADSIKFNLVSALIIIVNAVLVGIEIENGRVNAAVQDRVPWYAELTEYIFLWNLPAGSPSRTSSLFAS